MARKEEKFQGEAFYSNVTARKNAKGQQLGPGLWALHGRSTVPFIRVNIGAVSSRSLSWGEIYEVPQGHFGSVQNDSFHDGDIWLVDTGGDTAPPRPARITVPAPFVVVGGGDPGAQTITPWVDTRLARRAYLAVHPVSPGPGSFTYTVLQQAPTQGGPISTTGAASKNTGIVVMNRLVVQPLEVWPLGFGSGEYLDTAGNSYPELRPMSLLDRARVRLLTAEAITLAITAETDAFFILEY